MSDMSDVAEIEYTEAREPHDEQVQVWEEEVARPRPRTCSKGN